MSKENIILVDYETPYDWEFHKAIENITGNKFQPIFKAGVAYFK